MRLFADIEKTIERGLRQWTERLLGPAASAELLLVHRRILEDVEEHIQTMQRGRRVFPYNAVTVRLVSSDAGRRSVYAMAFEQDRRLENDLRKALEAADCEVAPGFHVAVETAESGPKTLAIEYRVATQTAEAAASPVTGPGRLVVVKGKAREAEYRLERARTLIGRTEELTDHEERVVRRNDVVFDEGADDANATVSRRHAQIRYDAGTGEYRLADDGSEYGTRIFREGRPIDVMPGNRRGERLRPGDEIYLGRACVRFER
jgi:hypothetical protein